MNSKFKVGDWVKFKLRKNYPLREIEYIRDNGNLILKNEEGDYSPNIVTLSKKLSANELIEKINDSPERTDLVELIIKSGWEVNEFLNSDNLLIKGFSRR